MGSESTNENTAKPARNNGYVIDSDPIFHEQEKYPWAGPALFITVLTALVVFFWWFL